MPLFLLNCVDSDNSAELRAQNRDAHFTFINASLDKVKLGGAVYDAAGQPNGSAVVVEADDLAAAEAWSAQDPYRTGGVWKSVQVQELRLAIGKV